MKVALIDKLNSKIDHILPKRRSETVAYISIHISKEKMRKQKTANPLILDKRYMYD